MLGGTPKEISELLDIPRSVYATMNRSMETGPLSETAGRGRKVTVVSSYVIKWVRTRINKSTRVEPHSVGASPHKTDEAQRASTTWGSCSNFTADSILNYQNDGILALRFQKLLHTEKL
ncbi:hypothetical protein OESDEN_22437 [Oesophagostomum dentatum]|uniref:Uncharacterized protein n=1 Tax=Oesophagostomum dentatum TaxID=61180 RepID=A0A0B1RXZ2_OESDE|nr:hypothetical protein OESDEN_22437 [Oesophagostomum dentatum]